MQFLGTAEGFPDAPHHIPSILQKKKTCDTSVSIFHKRTGLLAQKREKKIDFSVINFQRGAARTV